MGITYTGAEILLASIVVQAHESYKPGDTGEDTMRHCENAAKEFGSPELSYPAYLGLNYCEPDMSNWAYNIVNPAKATTMPCRPKIN